MQATPAKDHLDQAILHEVVITKGVLSCTVSKISQRLMPLIGKTF
jgi:hypothetical protein